MAFEKHCVPCGGMVNLAGCGKPDCFVVPAEPKKAKKKEPSNPPNSDKADTN